MAPMQSGTRVWLGTFLLCATMFCACDARRGTLASTTDVVATVAPRMYTARGVVREVDSAKRSVVIDHEEIQGFMPAMVMPFLVKDAKELEGLESGDKVSFRIHVTEDDGWIDQVTRTGGEETPDAQETFRIVRMVEPLEVGDAVPDYPFTNQWGQAISLRQFQGRALAITFIFTRCPFPTFCPRMSGNFEEAQRALKAMTDGPSNWHLLTLSFDPEFDTPEVLRAYAERFSYDPEQWTFGTGALIEIDAITEQFGLMFPRVGLNFDHNLRTVVLDANGRVQKLFIGNEWKTEELVSEMVKAASVERP